MANHIEIPGMPQIKKWSFFVYALIAVGVMAGGQLLNLITDYYWFKEIGFTSLFSKSLIMKLGIGSFSAVIIWLVLYLNLSIAKRISRKPFVLIEPDATITSPLPLARLMELKPLLQVLLTLSTFVISFLVGNWALGKWDVILKFLNGVPFQSIDPLFNRDMGFYIFTLPFYQFLYHLFLSILILSLIITLATYVLNSRIYFTENRIKIADDSKTHLAVLVGFLCLLLAASFQLKMYDLLYLQRSVAPGAGYADINAYLPGLKLLRFIAVVSAILLWISPWFANTKIIFGAVVLLVGGTILTRVYAGVIQKFQVGPNEIAKETHYIQLGIKHTREAYGITDVQELEFDPQENLTPEDLRRNDLTIKNIRLWEHRPLLTTYGQLQEIRTYYDFLDADNDRYWINGEYRQVMISARELEPGSLPSRIWINEHLTYTHGYGICMGPVNRISPEGLPEFFVKDIPPVSTFGLKVTRPEIYFGESKTNYAIVKTHSKEFDYPAGDENVYSTYEGSGGVPVQSFWKRLIFAARFRELKILFSGDITPESKFLYHRSVRERLLKAAPFLHYDADPYIVISDEGKLFWIVDGYSVTDRYPYSEKTGGINYIRNSVKATVDAYNGSIVLYVSDPKDPIIKTYARIFPKVFKSIEEMPKDLRSHIRYPQTLMNIQAKIYATYHMTDPQVFYNKEDLWKIPVRTAGGRSEPMEPYYTIMKLTGVGEREEFILMAPFTPAKKENMIAWMAARCDEPNYGKLLVYNFPKQKLVYGPQQIESRIDQDAEISKQLTLWDQGGSRVLRGNLLVIPVNKSLLYIQPLYLEASGGGLPELKRIIVAYGNSIAMEENLELSLMRIFGGRGDLAHKEQSLAQPQTSKDIKTLIRQVREHFDKARAASRQEDWSRYGQELKDLERAIQRIAEIAP